MDQAGSSRRLAAERAAIARPGSGSRSPGLAPTSLSPASSPSTGAVGPNGSAGAIAAPDMLHPLEVAKSLRGESLDHFVLDDYVGIGGMGTVFRAHDKILNRTVAVKVLSRDQAHDLETIRRFRNEAQSAARLDHENIARVYYMGEARDLPYIVFEFIEGVNLRDLVIDRGPVPVPDAVSYVLQISGALAHASGRDVVHRDIKPSNILVAPDGKAKLVDMGLARLHDMAVSNDLTASGVTLGTFDYISPEQARNPRVVDVRSDIYSLGCTFFYIVTGRPPFPNGTVFQKLLQHQGEAPPDPRQFNGEIDAETARIMRKMMAKDPGARYQQCDELIRDLMLLAGSLGLRQIGPSGMVWVAPESLQPTFWERHLPWAVPVLALILAVVVLDWLPKYGSDNGSSLGPSGPTRVASDLGGTGRGRPVEPTQPRPTGEMAPIERVVPAATSERPAAVGTNSIGPFVSSGAPGRRTPGSESPSDGNPGVGSRPTSPSGESGTNTTNPATTTPSETNPRATTPSIVVGDYVVRKGKTGAEVGHNSLAAACAASESGDVIELRFHGRRIERPVVLQNKDIVLVAAPNVDPVVTFQYDVGAVGEPTTHMITLIGGRLSATGIGFEAPVDRNAAAINWSLFRTRGAREIRLQRCWLSMQNPAGHLHASFVEVASVPGAEAMLMVDPAMPNPEAVDVQLSDVLAFGQAVFLRSDEQQPVSLGWSNGWVRLTQPFLEVDGGSMAPNNQQQVKVALRRVTADVRAGLARLTYSDSGAAPPNVSFDVEQSLLVCDQTAPMIVQVGAPQEADARLSARFTWRARDVYFDNIQTFWRVEPIIGETVDWGFPSWSNYWGEGEKRSQIGSLPWASMASRQPDLPVQRSTIERYQLHEPFSGQIGANFSSLPSIPRITDPGNP